MAVARAQSMLKLKEWSLPAHPRKPYMVIDDDGKAYIGWCSRAAACLSTHLKLMRPGRLEFLTKRL